MVVTQKQKTLILRGVLSHEISAFVHVPQDLHESEAFHFIRIHIKPQMLLRRSKGYYSDRYKPVGHRLVIW